MMKLKRYLKPYIGFALAAIVLMFCQAAVDLNLPNLMSLSLIHISEPTRLGMISYAVFCLKKKKPCGSNIRRHISILR